MKKGLGFQERVLRWLAPPTAILSMAHAISGCSSSSAHFPELAFEKALAPRQSSPVSPCQDFFAHVCSHPRELTMSNHMGGRVVALRGEFRSKALDDLSPREQDPSLRSLRTLRLQCESSETLTTAQALYRLEALAWVRKQSQESILSRLGEALSTGEPGLIDYPYTSIQSGPERILQISSRLPEFFKTYSSPELISTLFKDNGASDMEASAPWLAAFLKDVSQARPDEDTVRRQSQGLVRLPSRPELRTAFPALRLDRLFRDIPDDITINLMNPEALAVMNARLERASLREIQALFTFVHLAMNRLYEARAPSACKKAIENLGAPILDLHLLQKSSADAARLKKLAATGAARILPSVIRIVNSLLPQESRDLFTKKLRATKLLLVEPDDPSEWDVAPLPDLTGTALFSAYKALFQYRFKMALHESQKRKVLTWSWLQPFSGAPIYVRGSNAIAFPYAFVRIFANGDPEGAGLYPVLGHEMVHVFTYRGKLFSETGAPLLLSDEQMAAINEKEAEFMTLLRTLGNIGPGTEAESMATALGLLAAEDAFLGGAEPERKKAQDFFLAFAHPYCNMGPLTDGPDMGGAYPSTREIINASIKLSKNFSSAFSCRKGDAMVVAEEARAPFP